MSYINFSPTGSKDYIDLIWDEFFLSRQRGLEPMAHFPWMRESCPEVIYAEMFDSGELLGGLVLKDASHCIKAGYARVASIGLVCVRAKFRGEGLSRRLLAATILHAEQCGFEALTLWTSKRGVYGPLGFVLEDRACFGWVDSLYGGMDVDPFHRRPEPGGNKSPLGWGIPPFGKELTVLHRHDASCVLVRDESGPIVVDCQGDPSSIASILEEGLPRRWRLNAFQGDDFLTAILNRGMCPDLRPTNLQMWLSIDGAHSPKELADNSRFTVLDRI